MTQKGINQRTAAPWWTEDEWYLAAIMLAVGMALALGQSLSIMVFVPTAWLRGEWWRIVTHPFAHVSLYHLFLDGSSFLILYHALGELGRETRRRLALAAGAGSLAAAALTPEFAIRGLCGLSGPAHGLMAVWGAHMTHTARGRFEYGSGIVCMMIPIVKSMIEAFTGHVIFDPFHFGFVGAPNAFAHAGGVITALMIALLLTHKMWTKSLSPNHASHKE